MKRSPLKRTPMARSRTRIKKSGRRTREWAAVWQYLKPRLEAAGRTRCELTFIPHVCSEILDPVHSKKRRHMQGNDIYAICIGCRTVHRHLDEDLSHADMEEAVMKAINLNGGLILPEVKE